MAIKKKDGTIYKLSSPNPLMIDQKEWGKNYKLHNFQRDGIKIEAMQSVVEEVFEEEIIVQELPSPKKKTFSRDVIPLWVLPAEVNESYDELYGETKKTIKYFEKFKTECSIIEKGGIVIRLVTKRDLTIGSIIFPQDREMTWWRIKGVSEQGEFFVIDAIISDFQPDFSD